MQMGRPQKEIDQTEFEKLCAIQCTRDEICGWFHVSEKTLDSWCMRTYGKLFSPVFAEKRGMGKISLRRAQFQLAQKNAAMAIWLGKQYLDQKDKIEEVKKFDTSQFERIASIASLTGEDADAGD